MCGIVGVISKDGAKDRVIEGLKKLEYRGYDSWGIALKNTEIKIFKDVGKISEVESADLKINSSIGIGHTRWATHGGVTKGNAHPHMDCSKNIAVVHNGIIENYQELKENLEKLGHKFISGTDTEVIPHLVEEYLKKEKDLFSAFRRALMDLKGNFTICLISKNSDKILAATNGCPLVLGINDNEKFISSDILTLQYAKEISFLKDGTVIEIGKKIAIYDIKSGKEKKFVFQKNNFLSQKVTAGKYKYFLLKEIHEQPEIIKKISLMDQKEIETNAALIRNSFGTFFVACGTSFHAGLVGEYLFAKNAKMHVNITSASEFSNFKYFLTDKTLLFPISQSGETADVLDAVKVAKAKDSKILSLVNNPNSTLARLSDVVMVTPAGPEIAVLSTKAFTSQMAILYLLAMAVAGDFAQGKKIIEQASLEMQKTFDEKYLQKLKKLANKILKVNHIFTLGRGLNYSTALEAALKIKESSYIHAEGFAGGDLKHGPIALIEKGTPVIVFVAEDEVKNEILSNAMEVKSRGAFVIGVAPNDNPIFDEWLSVGDLPEISPLLNIISAQLLSYYLTIGRGLNPDQPRNLAKSVTVK